MDPGLRRDDEKGMTRMAYDLLIKNGRIVDGSGGPSYRGDVAVKDGKIVEIDAIADPERVRRVAAPLLTDQ